SQRDEQHRERERLCVGDASSTEEKYKRHLTRADAVDAHREKHHEQDQRYEREIRQHREIDRERTTQTIRLDDSEHLHADRSQQHVRKLTMVPSVRASGTS